MYSYLLDLFTFFGLEKTANLERVLKNASWMLLDNIIRLVMGLWVISWMARYLGPDGFGLFNYALAFVSLFNTFATFGLNEIVVQFILLEPSRKGNILATAFILRCISGIAAVLLCLGAIMVIKVPYNTFYLVAIIAMGLVFQSFDVIDSYFQSQLQSKFTIFAKNSVFITMSLVKIYLITVKAPLAAFAWAALGEVVLGAISLVLIGRALAIETTPVKIDWGIAQRLIRACWPIFLSGIAFAFNMRMDQVLLYYFKGKYEVGIYAAAIKISELWYILVVVITSSVFPVIIKLKNDNEVIYRQKLRQIYIFLNIIGVAAALVTMVAAKPVVYCLYGAAYHQAAAVLSIHVMGLPVIFMGAATTYALITENLQQYQLVRTFLGCMANIILNLILIPRWGAAGAAVASVSSYIITVYSILFFKKARKIF